ncbi:MAG TPA: hypothetical protein VHS99_13985, partial [Chloroflexota bacterium]|nr:hypothetical protein [Chloroflexota bacterium]
MSLQVPGTPIELALPSLAGDTRLPLDVAARVLSRLAADGLIELEPEPESEQLTITVLLAPALDEYGIQPQWGEGTEVPPARRREPAPPGSGVQEPDAQESAAEARGAERSSAQGQVGAMSETQDAVPAPPSPSPRRRGAAAAP